MRGRQNTSEPEGRGAAIKGAGEAGGTPEESGNQNTSEPEGRGAAWTDERGS